MRFSIFTHAEHKTFQGNIYSYAPYVIEMNFWISKFDEICLVSPVSGKKPGAIDLAYRHDNIELHQIPLLYFKEKFNFFRSVFYSFSVIGDLYSEMKKTDHIHIRCPGNIGLLASLVQVFFPSKPKTIKYAGNWDPKSKQPVSYRLQKWLLSNTFFTHNAKVLVYGNWKGQSKNIVPFFTATYAESERITYSKNFDPPYKFVFAGSLVPGKRPLFTVKIIHELIKRGYPVKLDIYGDGKCRKELLDYISGNHLKTHIKIWGNQDSEVLKNAYKNAHFSILPSKSEGWPKAIAEGMFFGCVPIATNISCVPWMLDNGNRGILIKASLKLATDEISSFLNDQKTLLLLSEKAHKWSGKYTLDRFKDEIHKLL